MPQFSSDTVPLTPASSSPFTLPPPPSPLLPLLPLSLLTINKCSKANRGEYGGGWWWLFAFHTGSQILKFNLPIPGLPPPLHPILKLSFPDMEGGKRRRGAD